MKEFTTLPVGTEEDPPGELPWRRHAACRGADTELFFPAGTLSAGAVEQIEAAKAVCLRCTVRADCLEFALASNQEAGVWGGTSEEERRKLRRPWLRARRLASLRGAGLAYAPGQARGGQPSGAGASPSVGPIHS